MSLAKRFQKIDPYLGAMVVGAKVTWHGARVTGAKTLTRGADVAGSWRRDLWRQDLVPLSLAPSLVPRPCFKYPNLP
jgi:hypothetical protein